MYEYYISQHFKKCLKPYLKKYRSLLDDIIDTLSAFDKQTSIALGSNTYKLRIASRDLPKGKSHAFRMIVLIVECDNLITPVIFYAKSDRASISSSEIELHAAAIMEEIRQGIA